MGGFGQKVLAQLVQDDELTREDLGHLEALRHEHDLANEGEVRHAHGHGAEEGFEGLGQLGTAGVARVHRDERHHRAEELDLHLVEDKAVLLGPYSVQHRLVLRGAHGEDSNGDAVELVEAAPRAGLRQTLVNAAHDVVVHLVRAVEDVHRDAKCARQVLDCLGLARARGPGGGTSEAQPLSLSQRDVAPVSQRGDAQAPTDADVLVAVRDLGVANVDLKLPSLLVLQVTELGLPLETIALLHALVHEALHHITRVHVDGT